MENIVTDHQLCLAYQNCMRQSNVNVAMVRHAAHVLAICGISDSCCWQPAGQMPDKTDYKTHHEFFAVQTHDVVRDMDMGLSDKQ